MMQLASKRGALSTPSENEAKDLFRRQLGVEIDRKREASMVEAISKPENWLKERNEQLDKTLDEAALLYRKKYEQFIITGYPVDQADAMAVSLARNLYENEKKIIEDLYVGYEGQFKTREINRSAEETFAKSMISGVDKQAHITEADRKGIIREYKKRKGYGKYAKK